MTDIFTSTDELIEGCGLVIDSGQQYSDVMLMDENLCCGDCWKNKIRLCQPCKIALQNRLAVFKAWQEFIDDCNGMFEKHSNGKTGVGKLGLKEQIKKIEETLQ